jgi:hypothetical protein
MFRIWETRGHTSLKRPIVVQTSKQAIQIIRHDKAKQKSRKTKVLSHKSIWCRRKVCFDTKIYCFCLPKRTSLLHFTSQCGWSLIQGNKKSYLSLSDFSGSGLVLELWLHDFFPNAIFSNTLFSNIHFPEKHLPKYILALT